MKIIKLFFFLTTFGVVMGSCGSSSLAKDHKKKIQNSDLVEYYQAWKKDYLVCDKEYCRVASDKKDRSKTVSEGQGYGMLITSLMAKYDKDAQKIFDKLLFFAKANPSNIEKSFMAWQVPSKKDDRDSAFDGDSDIAYSLLIASKIWGDSGKINYKKEAQKIINALANRCLGVDSHLPLLGDWVEQDGKDYNQYTVRTSDFMLGHFRAFYRVSGDKRWLLAIKASQKALIDIQNLPSNKSSLVSDFIIKKKDTFVPTKRKFLEDEDDSYYYNACRVPWRVGVDVALNADEVSKKILFSMLSWMDKNANSKAKNIKPGYRLDGTPIATDYQSSAFIAPFGVAAMLDDSKKRLYESIISFIKKDHDNYYEDSINLLCQLVIRGEFIDPSK